MFTHIHIAVFPECDSFRCQLFTLLRKMRGQSACMINNPMAWIISVKLGHTQHFADEPGVFVPSDQTCNLAIGSHTSFRDFFYSRQDFIFPLIQSLDNVLLKRLF